MEADDLVLTKLTDEQISLAKQASGSRLQITHALLCGSHGQLFGTENHCTKYYTAWKQLFKRLFHEVYKTEGYPIRRYQSTFNLVMLLIQADDRMQGRRRANR